MGKTSDDSDPSFARIHLHAANTSSGARGRVSPTLSLPTNESPHAPDSDAFSGPASGPAVNLHSDGHVHVQQPAEHGEESISSSSTVPIAKDTRGNGEETASVTDSASPSWPKRMKAGSKRFVQHTRDALLHSWINILLIFVPVGIGISYAPLPPKQRATLTFALNAVAIVPLAGLLSHATEAVASRMGDTWASLLNVTFGNAVELIIFIIALAKNEIRIVQASILGSILANLLLILGMAFLLGGLRYQEQVYNSTVTQMSACLLSLSVMSLLLPTAFHASFADNDLADHVTTKISRGTSVILLLVYILYLLFQLKSHTYMYESTPQDVIDEESHPGFFREMLNASTTNSSSSSSSDTDSTDSHTTTKTRIKRAFRRRRKSSTSSMQTGSALSATSSPIAERRNMFDESLPAPRPPALLLPERTRRGSHLGVLLSGDEADIDGEDDQAAPRVRDFEAEQVDGPKSLRRGLDVKHKRRHKSKHRKSKDNMKLSEKVNELESAQSNEPRVGFIGVLPADSITSAPSPKRPVKRQLSRPFRAPLPSLLSNNVFVSAPTAHSGGSHAGPLSLARSVHAELRRTNSLPDRLNRQQSVRGQSVTAARAELSHGSDPFAINEADAIRKDKEDEKPHMSRTAAVMLLLISTGLVAYCAELLVDAIPVMVESTGVSQAFIGLIILPIVGNAAEHVTAVTVAAKNKMDLAIGVAVGSSIQIALFVTPFVVLLGWIMEKEMSLYFNIFETVSLFVTAFVVNFLVLDGRSNYLEGSLLIAAYTIIAVAAFFYPSQGNQSVLGGADST